MKQKNIKYEYLECVEHVCIQLFRSSLFYAGALSLCKGIHKNLKENQKPQKRLGMQIMKGNCRRIFTNIFFCSGNGGKI